LHFWQKIFAFWNAPTVAKFYEPRPSGSRLCRRGEPSWFRLRRVREPVVALLRGSVMNNRFDSVERRLEMIQGNVHEMDIRLTKLESR
jgi:hypothetical protein